MHQQDKTDPPRFYPILRPPTQKNKQISSMEEGRKAQEKKKFSKEGEKQKEKKGKERIRRGNSTSNRKAGEWEEET